MDNAFACDPRIKKFNEEEKQKLDGCKLLKARLVARGFEEKLVDKLTVLHVQGRVYASY